MGSTTPTSEILKKRKRNSKIPLIEINSPESCKISGNKILMKTRFTRAKVDTAEWFVCINNIQKISHYLNKWKKIIIKHKNSSGGNGIYLIESIDDFIKFASEAEFPLNTYICERYYTYSREYRLHITKDGCFLADRKMLKNDADVRWHRHANNSVWISEENPKFNRPDNWDLIVKSCVNALKSVGLDIAAFDIKIQNSNVKNPKWIILECNSAPSLGEKSLELYKTKLKEFYDIF